jgi:hypothetical protein
MRGAKPFHIEQFTPEGAWAWDVRSGLETLSTSAALNVARYLRIGAFGMAQGAAGRDYAKVLGPMQMMGQSGEGVEVVTQGHWANQLFSTTGLLLAERYAVPGGSPETLVYSDYRPVGGIQFAFEIKSYVDQTLMSSFKMAEVQENPSFDADT